MEPYISKSAVVAEIKRRIFEYENCGINSIAIYAKIIALHNLLFYINTIKVKEVDLKEELDTWRHNHFHGRRDKDASGEYLERNSQLDIAKHFFELGLKTQKGK